MHEFKIIYENLVTDDIVWETGNFHTFHDAEQYALDASHRRSYVSSGNYSLYVRLGDAWVDVDAIYSLLEDGSLDGYWRESNES